MSKAAFDLRKFLEDNFKNPPSIVTIRKVGYRLEMNENAQKNSTRIKVFKILKIISFVVGIGVLLILVLRCLQY